MFMEGFLSEYGKRKTEIRTRLEEFKGVRGDDIFYEMCFCLLTPQSSGLRADACVQELKALDFFNNDVDPRPILKKKIRFHNNKSKYLLEMKKKYNLLKEKITSAQDQHELRDYLLDEVKGFGLKETHHFLRNIGYRNFAILDRHILRNLNKLRVIKSLPKTLTKKNYFMIEKNFKQFSENVGIPMDELDLLFWSIETGKVFK